MAGSKKTGGRGWIALAIVGGILLIATPVLLHLLGWSYIANTTFTLKEDVPARSELARFATGSISALETPAELAAAPAYVFHDRDGAEVSFADFRGKVTVVNLWAMWCAPCRTEMPTLAALQTHYRQRADFTVLPINVDVGAEKLADATSFIGVHEPLPLYNDPQFQLPFEFPARGKMPQTIVLDRQGRIRAWFAGEADWASPEAIALFDALLAEPV